MQESICDLHSHILPGLDDGAGSMTETLEALREARKQGVTQIIATPHYLPGKYTSSAEGVQHCLAQVRRKCERQRIDITLYAGHECYYFSDLVRLLEEGAVLTLAGSRYVLVEFDPGCPYSHLRQGTGELLRAGYLPVLAHFERYDCLRAGDRLARIRESGCLLQMNFDTLLQKDGLFRRNPWRKLVREGMVDLLGSDCHGTDFRPIHAEAVLSWMKAHTDPEIMDRMLRQNTEKILMNR